MKQIISTILIVIIIAFYGEVILEAVQEQQNKIENQEAEIEALTQLLTKFYLNPSGTSFNENDYYPLKRRALKNYILSDGIVK